MRDRRFWSKRAAWCLGVALLGYWVVWLAVPPLVKWQGERLGTAALGREVRIGRVAFSPWKLDLVLDDVQIGGLSQAGADSPPMLRLARLHLDFAASSLIRGAPVIQALDVDGLQVRLARLAPGRYDVDDLLARFTPKPGTTATPPLHFALYNVQLRDAAVRFDDVPAARVHEITAVHLALPFISNLPAQVDVKVEPHLAFRLNGVPFDSGALATPFAKSRSGELTFKVTDLDLAPYLGYLPDSLPLRVAAGTLSTDIAVRIALPNDAPPTLTLRGTLGIRDVQLDEPGGAPWLGWKRLDLDLRDAAPFAKRVALASVRVDGARLDLRRDAEGGLRLPGARVGPANATSRPPSSAAVPPASSASSAGGAPPHVDWQVEVDRLELANAAVAWSDAAVRPAASFRVDGVSAEARQIRWPIARPILWTARGSVRSSEGASAPGTFSIDSAATNHEARLSLSLTGLPIDTFGAYLAQIVAPRLGGRLSAQARIDWADGPAASARLGIVINSATLDGVTARDRKATSLPASMNQLSMVKAEIDVPARGVVIDRLVFDRPSLSLARSKDGQFDLARWLVPPAPPATSDPAIPRAPVATGSTSPPPPASSATPWRVQIRDVSLNGGRFQFTDAHPAAASAARPLRIAVDELRIAAQNFVWQADRPTVPAQIELSGRIGPPRAPDAPRAAGAFDWRGVVGATPLLLTGSLKLERVPAHLFMPYLGADLGVSVARAELGYVGNLSVRQLPAGLDVDAGADVLLGAVRIESGAGTAASAPAETLASWNTLGLTSARLSIKPGAPPQLDISKATLGDFYTRLAITEEGKLDLLRPADASPQAAPGPPAAAASAATALPLDIRLGGTTLSNGRIDFSDHYVRPNYSAALTELNGQLGPLRSSSPELATLTLHGKAAGTAVLDISGHVNPYARPLAFDLHAKATDLELAPLSPYAVKYAGHAIERGKLSMDVAYRLEPDGRLDAKNQVVLHQLTFGEKVESPTATRLPVLLAVALLKDRNGVIDLDLPISGSLDDPQFSVGAIVSRLLGNLLTKALTSPFALLTGGAGGAGAAGDPSQVEFIPGTTTLSAAGTAVVGRVAQALVDKPGLVLTVTGAADPRSEADAYRSAVLDERLAAVRQKETVASAAAASAPAPPLGTEARVRLLKQLYQDTDLADKPRNVFGIAKDLPATDMEARLKTAIDVGADTMRELALQRGVSVREALVARGLSNDRLFLAAPRLRPSEAEDAAAWTPQVQLTLTLN